MLYQLPILTEFKNNNVKQLITPIHMQPSPRYQFFGVQDKLPTNNCIIRSFWFDKDESKFYPDLKWRLCIIHHKFGFIKWNAIKLKHLSEVININLDTSSIQEWYIELVNDSIEDIQFHCPLFMLRVITN